jgi:hypothetical protein
VPPTVHSLLTCNMVHFPSEAVDQLCPTGPSTATSCSSLGFNNEQINTQVAAYLQPEVASSVTTSSTNSALDPTYTALLSEHLDPTAAAMDTSCFGYYDDDCSYNYGTVHSSCGPDNWLFWFSATAKVAALLALILLCLYVNVLDAYFPVIFFFGLLENYFWFRQMVHGKFSLRLGTALWVFLLPPALCLTTRCPARDLRPRRLSSSSGRQSALTGPCGSGSVGVSAINTPLSSLGLIRFIAIRHLDQLRFSSHER